MASRKDLLKAQSFTTQRMVNALVERNPDDPEPALKRSRSGLFVSILIGVVLMAGTMLLGFLRPGGSNGWREDGRVIQDISSGVLYVYNKDAEVLIPFTDMASARLYVGSTNGGAPATVNIKSKDIQGVPQAPRHTIVGAPYQLPDSKQINAYPLKVCSTAPRGQARFITMQIGQGTVPNSNETIVAQLSNGKQFMIINGISHELYQIQEGGTSPLIEGIPVVIPGDAWLEAIPKGAPINPPQIVDFGQAATDNARVGDIYIVGEESDPDARYYVMLKKGLTRITYLDMKALVAKYQTGSQMRPKTISDTELSRLANPDRAAEIVTDQVPYGRPKAPEQSTSLAQTSVCATYTEGSGYPLISIGDDTPRISNNVMMANGSRADVIEMSTLTGALFRNSGISGTSGSAFLITAGKSYGIPDEASREALGYRNAQVISVPGGLIQLVPPGMSPGVALSYEHISIDTQVFDYKPDGQTKEA